MQRDQLCYEYQIFENIYFVLILEFDTPYLQLYADVTTTPSLPSNLNPLLT